MSGDSAHAFPGPETDHMSTEARSALAAASAKPITDPTSSSRAGALAAVTQESAALPARATGRAELPLAAIDLTEMTLREGPHRDEIVKRLRRAEGQLRGIIRMLDEGQGCMAVAQQLTAVRKALDATMARMAVSYLEQELGERARHDPAVEQVGRLISRI